MSTEDDATWAAALVRGGELAQLSISQGTDNERSWDYIATRGIIAVALYSLSVRDDVSVQDVPLGRLVVPLSEAETLVDLLATALAQAAPGHTPATPAVWRQWTWLKREWNPEAPPGERWDGLTRGIGRGLHEPAVEVCLLWARAAVDCALVAERGGLRQGTAVRIMDGEYGGAQGRVEGPGWHIAGVDIDGGPPGAYLVNLGIHHGHRAEWIPAGSLDPIETSPATSG